MEVVEGDKELGRGLKGMALGTNPVDVGWPLSLLLMGKGWRAEGVEIYLE